MYLFYLFMYYFPNRAWLSKTKLKHVSHKIAVFNPGLLSGRISKDAQTMETENPVR